MRVAILGAGLTGTGTALELAAHGVSVTLIDQDEQPMNRASLRNEGKIHLGLLFANDRTFESARLQLQGALIFRKLLAGWVGQRANTLPRSTPFLCLVAPDSILGLHQLASHYAAVDAAYVAYTAGNSTLDYLGDRPATLWEPCPLSQVASFIRSDRFLGGFRTAELAIDTAALAAIVRGAVESCSNIQFLKRHRVRSVDRLNGLFRIEGESPDGAWNIEADQVVNALWEHRMAVDQMVGVPVAAGWVHRLKYRLIARLPPRLQGAPSVTIVIGSYGDVVVRRDGTVYLSWYPVALRGWTHDISPPDSWNAPCRGELADEEARSIAADVLSAIDAWYPGIGDSQPLLVDAGAIVAYGRTDVDDASSALHTRSRVGVTSVDGYHSVDPGKLTTAPLFAEMAAARVLGRESMA